MLPYPGTTVLFPHPSARKHTRCHTHIRCSLEEGFAAKEVDAKGFLKEVNGVKDEAQGLLHPRHLVLCRINNMAVRAAHDLLVARPHAQ